MSRMIFLPTSKLLPGEEWSSPPGSKSTVSKVQRIGQSTFHTSFPSTLSLRLKAPLWPQVAQRYSRKAVGSAYASTTVVSRWQFSQ